MHTYQPVQNQKQDKISEKAGFLVQNRDILKNYQVKRQTSAQKYSSKSGTAVNFELKIGTVPLKSGTVGEYGYDVHYHQLRRRVSR